MCAGWRRQGAFEHLGPLEEVEDAVNMCLHVLLGGLRVEAAAGLAHQATLRRAGSP